MLSASELSDDCSSGVSSDEEEDNYEHRKKHTDNDNLLLLQSDSDSDDATGDMKQLPQLEATQNVPANLKPLSSSDENIIFTHINLIDKQLIQWYNINTSKQKLKKHIKNNNNNNMYTISFLKDLYSKRQQLIGVLNKPYWLFVLESNALLRTKIINFNDGDVLGAHLKDIQLLPEIYGSNTKNDHALKNNRLVLSFIFHHNNNVIKNRSLSLYIYIDHTTGTLLLDWNKTRMLEENTLSFDEGCWNHGGPYMLMQGFFKFWRCEKTIDGNKSLNPSDEDLEQQINEMEMLERSMVYIINEILFFTVHSFHIGIKKILVDNDDDDDDNVIYSSAKVQNKKYVDYETVREKRIKNNPDRPKSLLHRLTFGTIPDYIEKVDNELKKDYKTHVSSSATTNFNQPNRNESAGDRSMLNINLPYWLQNDKERKLLRYKFKVMKHFDFCFVITILGTLLIAIYCLTLYGYIGNNDGSDPSFKTKQQISMYDKHPHENVYDMSFL